MKNSFSFSRYRLLKSKTSAVHILGFHRFPKKYCRAITVCDVTNDVYSQCEAHLHTEPRILFCQSRDLRKLILKIFTKYFVVCPLEPQRINDMFICPILSPYLSGPWSWIECQCHNDHALIVCDHVDGGIRLSGFVLAGFITECQFALFGWTIDGLSVSQ